MPSTFLTCKEQERLACFPDDIQQWDLITSFTLTEHDCSLIDTYQGDSNRLGAALQLVCRALPRILSCQSPYRVK